MDIRKVAVIGAGQMGAGIAEVCALAGYDVYLADLTQERLDAALAQVGESLQRSVDRGRLTAEAAAVARTRVSAGLDYGPVAQCQMGIETVDEDEDVKRTVLRALDEALPDDAVIGTNTQTISVTRLAAQTKRPSRVMGMHFMNPVPKMGLVELIRSITTDEETYAAAREFVASLGKTPISAEDFPAFVVNRVLMPMINEAIYALYEGVGSVDSIDTAMRLGTHHPMGPLELADFMGLDTCLGVMHILHEGLSDSKYRPCPLLVKYVEAGWLGRKTGRGFYDYSGAEPVPTR